MNRIATPWLLIQRATLLLLLVSTPLLTGAAVDTSAALVAAVRDGAEGATIEIAAGTFELEAPLEPKTGMTLKGAGMDQTIITHVAGWKPSTKTLPDPEMTTKGMDTQAYLIRLKDKAASVTISDLTLRGPQLHGAIYGWDNKDAHLHHLRIQDTLWSGIRTFSMKGAKIHDCEFIDAGGRWERGEPGLKGGITGGGIFAIWMADSEISHNRFVRTQTGPADEFYGIKGRQGIRTHIHHNTLKVNFSMEFPFENDEDMEIDHNVCHGAISIPKYAGGVFPKSGRTFHIHHNWMLDSYSIEFVRNGVEIDHNLFDFDVQKDGGNLISAFGNAAAKGPASFHNNLVSNPGRGVIWINEIYNNLEIRNNHIITRTTATPRKDGLFGFNPGGDFKTITIRDNVIECQGQARPLLRAKESYGAVIRNNQLTNVSDTDRFENPKGDQVIGLEKPLKFECGVHGEFTVDGWQARPTAAAK
jgi:nitrous oxidase accessory protein